MADPVGTASTTSRGEISRAVWSWTCVLALGGVVLLATATVDLVRGSGDGAVIALAFVGLALALGPVVFPRVHRFSIGADGFSFELSREIAEQLHAPGTARLLDRQGAGLAEAAYAYAAAHTVLRGDGYDNARVRLQDHFVDASAASALVQSYDGDELRRLFQEGPPVVRVLVLGLMRGDPSLADAATIGSAITESRSANEQYHGLRLAEVVGPRLSPEERRRLARVIEAEPSIHPGSDRSRLRAQVLTLLTEADLAEADASDDGGDGSDETSVGHGLSEPAQTTTSRTA
jgi:hypothetical protein